MCSIFCSIYSHFLNDFTSMLFSYTNFNAKPNFFSFFKFICWHSTPKTSWWWIIDYKYFFIINILFLVVKVYWTAQKTSAILQTMCCVTPQDRSCVVIHFLLTIVSGVYRDGNGGVSVQQCNQGPKAYKSDLSEHYKSEIIKSICIQTKK